MNLKHLIKFGMEESQEPVIKNPFLRQALEPRTMVQEPRNMADGGRIGFKRGNITTHPVTPLSKDEAKIYKMVQEKKLPHQRGASGSTKLAQTYNKPWEELLSNQRRNFRQQIYPYYKDLLAKTKGMVSRAQLSEILTEKFGRPISLGQIHGYGGTRAGGRKKTEFSKKLDELLDVKRITEKNPMYKIPTDADIKKLEPLLDITPANSLKNSTVENVVKLNKKYGGVYKNGKLPNLETILKHFPEMTATSASNATIRLSQIYNGNKFKLFSNLDPKLRKAVENIKVDKKTGGTLFKLIEGSSFNEYRRTMYRISLGMIDEKLGNSKGTFEALKLKARDILKENKIPVYSPAKKNAAGKVIQKAKPGFNLLGEKYSPAKKNAAGKVIQKAKPGFNINEIAGVSGSAKSKAAEFSQFIDIMEGNLNQKTLANFQSMLSRARASIEKDPSKLSSESKRINKLARDLENAHGIKLPRLRDPDAVKYFSPKRLKELQAQGLDIVKAAERAGYTVQMPKGAITAKEFTELDNKKLLKFFKDAGIPCIKGVGGDCTSIADFNKGYNKLVQEGAEGSAKAIQKLGKFTKLMRGVTGAAKWTGYGLLAEAGFMVPFAIGDYAAGKSWKRIVGNATDYGFGPIFGQSELEEFKEYLPKGSAAVQRRNIMELGERLYGMEQQKVNPGYGRIGYREKAPIQRQKVYDSILDEYILNMQPFMRTSPHLEESRFYDQGLMDKAEREDEDTMKRIAAADQKRIDERIKRGIIADRNWQSQSSYAHGGIMGLKKKW